MSFAEKQTMIGKSTQPDTTRVQKSVQDQSDGDYITYIVRYGDTIWDIVKMFGNVTTSEVLALNNISDPQKIQVGQKLKIKKKSDS
jgi:LysM repeat protein